MVAWSSHSGSIFLSVSPILSYCARFRVKLSWSAMTRQQLARSGNNPKRTNSHYKSVDSYARAPRLTVFGVCVVRAVWSVLSVVWNLLCSRVDTRNHTDARPNKETPRRQRKEKIYTVYLLFVLFTHFSFPVFLFLVAVICLTQISVRFAFFTHLI